MKDTQYFPGPPKSWNGNKCGIMSGGGAPTEGRGAPWAPAHHPLPRPGHQLLGFLGAAPAAHHPWPTAAPKPPPTTSGIDLSSRPPAGIDLSTARSPLPNGALNGASAPTAVPKESVSVIAPNPLRPPPPPDDTSMAVDDDEDDDEDEDCMVIDAPPQPPAAHSAPAAAGTFHPPRSLHLPSFPMPPRPVLPPQATIAAAPTPPPPASSAAAQLLTASQLPSHRQAPAILPPPPVHLPSMSSLPTTAPLTPSNHRPSQALDHVESLLENMFQQQEEPPIPHPVIVPNSLRPPLLTEDKVVAMLEEPALPEKSISTPPIRVPSAASPPTKNLSSLVSAAVPPTSHGTPVPPVSSVPTTLLPSSVPKTGPPPTEAAPGPPPTSTATPVPPSSRELPATTQQSSSQANITVSTSDQVTPAVPPSETATPAAPSMNSSGASSTVGIEQMLSTPTKDSAETPNTFLQVESELARMFAGIVEPSEEQTPTTTVHKEIPTPASASSTIGKTPARRGRKPDRGRPRKNPGLVRERHVAAPPPPKDGSSDGSLAGARARGPFLRISGDRLCPSVVLVNAARDDEERDRPADPTKRRHPKIVEGRVKGQGLYTSTLAAKYNSNSLDITWTCAFCHKRSHCSGGLGGEAAGDLFGPYTVTLREVEKVDGPSDGDVAAAQRLHGSRGRGQSLRAVNAVNSVQHGRHHHHHHHHHKGGTEESEEGKEVWAHEQCIIWAPGVMMVGPHLVGLDDALSSSLRSKCTQCGEVGAGIGCLEHTCAAVVHYGCAVSARWQLDEETFHAHCPLHVKVKSLTLEMLKSGT